VSTNNSNPWDKSAEKTQEFSVEIVLAKWMERSYHVHPLMLGSRTPVNVYTKMMECKASPASIRGGNGSP
jgi:hypothetical protein